MKSIQLELTFIVKNLKIILTTILIVSIVHINKAQVKEIESNQITITKKKLEEFFRNHNLNNDFSGIALIANNDSILFEFSIGQNTDNTRIRKNSKFPIASLSKTFCAAAIIKLIENGKLKLDDPVQNFVDGFDKHITIEQLLLHKSGIPSFDYENNPKSLEQVISTLKEKEFYFEPGTDNKYSNEGYSLLALIIEKVSGLSYSQFLKKEFFDEQKMNSSGVLPNDSMPDLINGYRITSKGLVPANHQKYIYSIGSGSNYSSINDLLIWARLINSNKIVDFDKLRYPYGWGKRNYFGHSLIEQSGLINGYVSYIAIYPQAGLYIIFLSNISSGFFNVAPIDIPAILFKKPIIPQNKYLKTFEPLDIYEGNYETEYGEKFKITNSEGQLLIHWKNRPDPVLLTPSGENEFINREDFSKCNFHQNTKGMVIGITITIKNFSLECKKNN